ncbi:MAG: alpha-glucosidase C-terminal domain-containing protein, partial [Tetragenococcus halophilus]|nr:alpha-glucosidase C-terminal domain-containing protein [Tetragenococcus halophilus]
FIYQGMNCIFELSSFSYKELIELRKNNYDIINGEYQTLNTGNPDVLAYIRYNENEQIIVVVNFSRQLQQYSLQTNLNHSKYLIHNYNTEIDSSNELQAYEAFAVKVSRNNL